MGVGGQRHAPAALYPRERPGPIVQETGWAQGRSGRLRKSISLTGVRSSDRPVRGESLYRLSYRGPRIYECTVKYVTF